MGLTDLNEGERKHNGCSRFQQVAIAVLHAHALRTKGGGAAKDKWQGSLAPVGFVSTCVGRFVVATGNQHRIVGIAVICCCSRSGSKKPWELPIIACPAMGITAWRCTVQTLVSGACKCELPTACRINAF